jgi:hypothetical protein
MMITQHLKAIDLYLLTQTGFFFFFTRAMAMASTSGFSLKHIYPHLVFVYGTLKRGEPNHFLLQDETKGRKEFVGEGRTENRNWQIMDNDLAISNLAVAVRCNTMFTLTMGGTVFQQIEVFH